MVRKIKEGNNPYEQEITIYKETSLQFEGTSYPDYDSFIDEIASFDYEIYYEDKADHVVYVTLEGVDMALCYEYVEDSDLVEVYLVDLLD